MRYSLTAATDFANSLDYTDKNYTAAQVIRWLDGAEVNGAGKFTFYEDNNYANIEKHPNWNPTFHILHDGNKILRCGRMFALDMIAAGKGIHDGTTEEFKARRGW